MKKLISLCVIVAVIAVLVFVKNSDPKTTDNANKEAPDPTAFDPSKPTSSAIVQVHPSMLAITQGNPVNRNYMEDEFELIVAPDTLKLAAKTLQLDLEEDTDALLNLKRKIKIAPLRGTDLIQITAQGTDKTEATRIANAVSNAYIKHRTDQEKARANKALAELDQEVIQQSEMVQKQRQALSILIQKYGIPYSDNGQSSPMGATGQDLLQSARKKLTDFKTQRDQITGQLKTFTEITEISVEDHVAIIAALDHPDNLVINYYNEHLAALKQKQALIAKDLEPNHPSIVAAEKRAADAMTNAQKEALTLKAILKTHLALVDRQIERMKEMVAEHQPEADRENRGLENYNKAKEAYVQSRDMLREMKIKQQEARVLLKMPRQPITLHERAK